MNSYVSRALRATPRGVSEYTSRLGETVTHFTYPLRISRLRYRLVRPSAMPRRDASVRWVIVASCSRASSICRSRRDSTSMDLFRERREKPLPRKRTNRPSACHLQAKPQSAGPIGPALRDWIPGERSTYERRVHELNVKSLNDFAGSVNTRILHRSESACSFHRRTCVQRGIPHRILYRPPAPGAPCPGPLLGNRRRRRWQR